MTEKARKFWSLVAFNLTVTIRESQEKFSFNEVLYTILKFLTSADNEMDENGSQLLPILFEIAQQSNIESSLFWAIESASDTIFNTNEN